MSHARFTLLFLVALLLACSQTETPTGGEDPPDDSELVSEETIDEAGGSLGDESVSIHVDAGGFDGAYDLALYREAEPSEDFQAGPRYRLEGLPATCALRVELEAPEAEANGNFIQCWDGQESALFPATLEDGFLVADLLIEGGGRYNFLFYFMGMIKLVEYDYPNESDPRFHVKVPLSHQSAMNDVLGDLVSAAEDLSAAGVSFHGYDEHNQGDLDVHVMEARFAPQIHIDPSLGAVSVYATSNRRFLPHGSRDGQVALRPEGLSGEHLFETRLEAAGEYVQMLADIALETLPDDPRRHAWIPLAARRWGALAFGPEEVEPEALEDESLLAPLLGIVNGADTMTDPPFERFAEGMSEFFYWACLPEHYGLSWFGSMLTTDAAATSENISLAFNADPSSLWWNAWVGTLFDGEYLGLGDVIFAESAMGTWSVNDEDDSHKTFEGNQGDLSAAWYNVRLDHDGFSESARVRFSLSSSELGPEDLELQVYKRFGGELTLLERADEVTIENLRDLRIQGAHLLAVVSNCHLGFGEPDLLSVNLHVEIEEEPESGVFDMSRCEIRMESVSEYLHYEGDDCTSADHWVTNDYAFPLAGGTWSGTTFTLIIDEFHEGSPDFHDTGILTVEMDEEGQEVQSFDLDWTREIYWFNSTETEDILLSWTGAGLPRVTGGEWDETYELESASVGDHLSVGHSKATTANDCVRSTTNLDFSSQSRVVLGFQP